MVVFVLFVLSQVKYISIEWNLKKLRSQMSCFFLIILSFALFVEMIPTCCDPSGFPK